MSIKETSIVECMKKAFDTKEKLIKEVEVICISVGITVDQLKKLPELREEEIKRLHENQVHIMNMCMCQ